MTALMGLLWPLQTFNDVVLRAGRWISVVAVALMVMVTLVQVFFRYALNNALPWPDEAARFMMLWMTGLLAPLAYRRGGFVAIDMFAQALPKRLAAALSLVLLVVAALVLVKAVGIGQTEVTGFMSKAKTASLYYPTWDLTWVKMPRSWMMLSFHVGMILLLVVNTELILRSIITMLGGGDRLKVLAAPEDELMAE